MIFFERVLCFVSVFSKSWSTTPGAPRLLVGMEVARSTRRRVSDDVTVRCRSGKRMRVFGGVDASLGCILLRLNIDSMALVLSFLEVDESYRFLTWPLNKVSILLCIVFSFRIFVFVISRAHSYPMNL